MEKQLLIKKLRNEMKTQKISFKEMAERVGFSQSNIRNIFNSDQRLHLDFYLKACEVLGKHPCQFLDSSYLIKDEPPEPQKVNEKVPVYPKKESEIYVLREDYVFLQRQIEVLNQIIIKKL